MAFDVGEIIEDFAVGDAVISNQLVCCFVVCIVPMVDMAGHVDKSHLGILLLQGVHRSKVLRFQGSGGIFLVDLSTPGPDKHVDVGIGRVIEVGARVVDPIRIIAHVPHVAVVIVKIQGTADAAVIPCEDVVRERETFAASVGERDQPGYSVGELTSVGRMRISNMQFGFRLVDCRFGEGSDVGVVMIDDDSFLCDARICVVAEIHVLDHLSGRDRNHLGNGGKIACIVSGQRGNDIRQSQTPSQLTVATVDIETIGQYVGSRIDLPVDDRHVQNGIGGTVHNKRGDHRPPVRIQFDNGIVAAIGRLHQQGVGTGNGRQGCPRQVHAFDVNDMRDHIGRRIERPNTVIVATEDVDVPVEGRKRVEGRATRGDRIAIHDGARIGI